MRTRQGENLKKYNYLYRKMDDFYRLAAQKSGLSDSAFWILYTICEYGNGCLQRDVCNTFYVNKQTVHSSVRRLEEGGYLYLKSGKGRDKHIFLTEAGERLIEEKIAPFVAVENAALKELGERETDEMLRLTERYLEQLSAQYEKMVHGGQK